MTRSINKDKIDTLLADGYYAKIRRPQQRMSHQNGMILRCIEYFKLALQNRKRRENTYI